MHLWHDLPAKPVGEDAHPELVHAVVEIPRFSRNKYEYDKEYGVFTLDRVLYSSIVYPGDYGFIPQTYYDDSDPLDILVMVNQPTFSGCVLTARPIGLFQMLDKGEPDDKILAVPNFDPIYKDFRGLEDVPQHFLLEVEHFFSVYKDLEGARVVPVGWQDADVAGERVQYAVELYREKIKPTVK